MKNNKQSLPSYEEVRQQILDSNEHVQDNEVELQSSDE